MVYKIPKNIYSAQSFDTEIEARMVLDVEGEKLLNIAKEVWKDYYSSYTPSVYDRSKGLRTLDGIKLGVVKRDGVIGFQVIVTFEDKNMYKNSYVGANQPKGHALMLISSGWTSKKLEARIGKRERFTRYKGFNYLGKVMAEYHKKRNPKVGLEISWEGNKNYTK